MNIKKVLGCAILAITAASASFALTVDKAEIESVGNGNVVFRNYSGPHTVINSVSEIRAIGSSLGENVKASPEKSVTSGSAAKYQIIHAVDLNTKEKLDADIFIIGKNATVDHIDNVRRIISSYLAAAYGYSLKDADTIATFVTVYNAVYRGKLDYFGSRYKQIVMDNLTAEKVGISTDYQEWPGNSQLIIPLSDLSGGLSTVDTSLISDRQVVKNLQNEKDKGIDARKDMVDIKEREADNAQDKAQASQKKATEENEKLKAEQAKSSAANKNAAQAQKSADTAQKKADTAQKTADTAQKKADTAQKKADANPNDKQAQAQAAQAKKDAETAQQAADTAQKAADDAQKSADAAQKAADEQNKKTEEQAQKATEASNNASEAQDLADKKRTEAQEERTSIAKDQQTIIREANENSDSANFMYGLKNVDELGATSEIVKLSITDGSLLKESPVTVIRGRTVYEDGDNFVAVAGSNFGNGAVKLVLIDKENLEIVGESKEQLSELSVLVEKDGNYYTTIQEGRDFFIGKFNNKAELMLKSPVNVKAATPITITSRGVLVNTANNNPAILKVDDLSLIGEGTTSNSNKAANIINAATNVINSAAK